MSVNYGYKRIAVGAHYGVRDWLAQRVTAVLMALFTFLVLARLLMIKGPIGYDQWAGMFSSQWMKALTFTVIISLLYHVWVGMRNVFMDYIKPTPIVAPLSSASWGEPGVLPRDLSNGIESAKGAGVHPDYYYWD